jgi:hypothetical protein
VETKYTEPFSPTPYRPEHYRRLPAYQAAGFDPGAAGGLGGATTNQLWRNTLLAATTRQSGDYDLEHAVVIAGRDDRVAWRAVAAVRAELQDPDGMLRSVSLERLVEQCRLEPSLAGWAAQFRRRYLELSPIADHFAVPTTPVGEPVVSLGTVVSATPSGWDHKGHPDGPQLDSIPDLISGPLQGWPVDEQDHGLYYFRHIVGGLDVDPATIETTVDQRLGSRP